MHCMCENNERYDYNNCKMDTENNAMHVNHKHKF